MLEGGGYGYLGGEGGEDCEKEGGGTLRVK